MQYKYFFLLCRPSRREEKFVAITVEFVLDELPHLLFMWIFCPSVVHFTAKGPVILRRMRGANKS